MTRGETGVCRSMWKRASFAVFAIAAVFAAQLLLMIPAASAQSIFAALSGTVRDTSGAVVPGAEIAIKNTSTQTVYKSVTNREGYFSANTLPFGTYEVRASAKGFSNWVVKDVVLHPSDSKTVSIDLKVATTNEQVEVVAVAEGVVTIGSGEKAYTLQAKDLRELALVGRNATEIVRILPGATMSNNGALSQPAYSGEIIGLNFSVGGQTGGLSSVKINGQAAEITQDGQRTMDPGAAGSATPIVANPDMISEVQVQTSNFSAENAQGPVNVNNVTQSGGNAFHGNLRFYARDQALNAEEHFYKESSLPKPPQAVRYPGFSIGGPIIIPGTGFNKSRKKLYFFDGFEYYKQLVPAAQPDKSFIPTADMLNGDFSALVGNNAPNYGHFIMWDTPQTPNSSWLGMAERPGCAISNGVMNSACVDPIAQAYLKAVFPSTLPTQVPDWHDLQNGTGTRGFNYVSAASVDENSWQNMVRGDYNITDNTKVYVTWSRHRETNNMPFGLWNNGADWSVPSPSGVVGNNGADNYTATFLHVFSPTMTLEGKFGYMKLNLPSTPTNPAKIDRSSSLFPLTGLYNPVNIPAIQSWGDSIPGLGDVGHSYHPGMIAVKGIPSTSANLTKVYRTHTTKFGFYYEHLYNKQDNWGQYMGVFQYASWSASPTGNLYADMLMGMGQQQYYEQAQPQPSEMAQNKASWYAQDDWKLNRRITINFGMRFEHIARPYSPTGNIGLPIWDTANYANPGSNANPGVLFHNIDSSLPLSGLNSRLFYYSPRVGAVIDVFGTGKTVIRGGWGKYRAYDTLQGNQYTGPAGTSLGSVAVICGTNVQACATWEDIDLHNANNCIQAPCAPKPVFGKPNLINANFSVLDPRFNDSPLVTTYSLNVDQQLPSKFALELSYVGNHSDFLQGTANINSVPIGRLNQPDVTCNKTDAGCQQLYRPFGALYQNINASVTAGKAQFDSLQASLQRNVGRLTLQTNYTWSKALGVPADAGNLNNGTLMGALPDFGAHFLWGIQPLDRGQAFSAAYVYRLPGVQGAGAFVRGLTNEWEISGITQIESGPQLTAQSGSTGLNYNLTIPSDSNITQAGTPDVTIYPVITCNPRQGLQKNQFINPNCFAPTPLNSLGDGHAPYLPGPMFWNTDLTVRKHVKITERQNLEFQVSSFNPLNHGLLSFATNDNNLKLQFDNSGKAPANFGLATHHFGHRVMEFGVKYNF